MNNPVSSIRTYPRHCIGCIATDRDVMIAFTIEGEKSTDPIHDIFLTQEQAKDLLSDLEQTIRRNATDEQ